MQISGSNHYEQKSPKIGPWVNYVIDAPEEKLDQFYKEEICNFWDSTKFYVDLKNDDVTTSLTSTTSDISGTDLSTTTKGLVEKTTSGAAGSVTPLGLLIVMHMVKYFFVDT